MYIFRNINGHLFWQVSSELPRRIRRAIEGRFEPFLSKAALPTIVLGGVTFVASIVMMVSFPTHSHLRLWIAATVFGSLLIYIGSGVLRVVSEDKDMRRRISRREIRTDSLVSAHDTIFTVIMAPKFFKYLMGRTEPLEMSTILILDEYLKQARLLVEPASYPVISEVEYVLSRYRYRLKLIELATRAANELPVEFQSSFKYHFTKLKRSWKEERRNMLSRYEEELQHLSGAIQSDIRQLQELRTS